jgi:hypothetical protein
MTCRTSPVSSAATLVCCFTVIRNEPRVAVMEMSRACELEQAQLQASAAAVRVDVTD